MADHGLKSGHHLVFEYDGKGVFDFLIFDDESNVKIAVTKRVRKNDSGKALKTLPVDSGRTSIIPKIKKETDMEVGGDHGGKRKDEEKEAVASDMPEVPHSKNDKGQMVVLGRESPRWKLRMSPTIMDYLIFSSLGVMLNQQTLIL
ncbi:unnamed protein product [Cuscuta europaea]|uniref:Uncharacterized protein n=1 Tax=Cuscuta europaea TaxID=41803 RepID=A0A9P1DWT3_CUSEU|nr:unnamed protein product [Cuscuta europaea]